MEAGNEGALASFGAPRLRMRLRVSRYGNGLGGHFDGRRFQEIVVGLRQRQQRCNFLFQLTIFAAGLFQELRPVADRQFEGGMVQALDFLPPLRVASAHWPVFL